MKRLIAAVAGSVLAFGVLADESGRRETVGVDAHYNSVEGHGTWAGELSYTRLFMPKLEVGGAYTFAGEEGMGRVQGLQLIGRQWFGPVAQVDRVSTFVQLMVGMEFAKGKYENLFGVGAGVGMFVSNQSELRLTLKGERVDKEDRTRFDAGYYYHF